MDGAQSGCKLNESYFFLFFLASLLFMSETCGVIEYFSLSTRGYDRLITASRVADRRQVGVSPTYSL